jgi:opacity protein-like surface antigen
MRKLFLLAAVLFVAAPTARAQDSYPSSEIFGGYAYLNADDVIGFGNESLHGFGLSFAGNLGPRVGLIAEISGHYGNISIPGGDVNINAYTFLFGPRFSARSDAATAFGHVLLGGARVKIEDFDTGTHYAMAIGGGVDLNVSKSVAIRLVQADYVPIRFGGEWLHNFRVMTGVVFKFGE